MCYFGILLAYLTSMVGWFFAAAGTRIREVPVVGQLIHHIVGAFFYASLMFTPVNAASDLLSSFTVNFVSSHFRQWASRFRETALRAVNDEIKIEVPSNKQFPVETE